MFKQESRKKWLSLFLVIAMLLTMIPTAAFAQSGSEESVQVTIRSQIAGEYLYGFNEQVTVSGDLAESYGYADNKNGVSALDALVKAHEIYYEKENISFTKDTAGDYLTVTSSGYVTRIFGQDTSANGFFINEGFPNEDGTGTTVTTQEIYDNDVIDFFIYSDEMAYMDYYTYIDAPSNAKQGEEITVVVEGLIAAYDAYLYTTPDSMRDAAKPLPEASYYDLNDPEATLVWINAQTGEKTAIENSAIDDEGKVNVKIPDDMESGEYYIAAESVIEDEYDVFGNTYIIKNPSLIYIGEEDVTLNINVSEDINTASLYESSDSTKTNVLESSKIKSDSSYSVNVQPGSYIFEGFNEDGTSLGTMEIFVEADKTTTIDVLTVSLSCENDSWIYGTDYEIDNLIIRGNAAVDGALRSVQMGTAADGTNTLLLLAEDQYSFDVSPLGDKKDDYETLTVEGIVNDQSDCTVNFRIPSVQTAPDIDAETIRKAYEETGAYLADIAAENGLTVASEGGDWIVLGLARAGYDVPDSVYQQYYDNVKEYVAANINENEQLHRSRSTENSRVILALTALGLDPSDVDGHNLLAGLSDMEYVSRQGINGIMYALIAFDSGNYDIPAVYDGGVQVTREGLISAILDAQLDDGGWSLAGTTADIDMTAIAVQALAPYYDDNEQVKTAVDEALQLLSERQSDNGGYGSFESANIESCAQVLTALTAMGIDPLEDGRFIKDGNTVLDAILGYYVEGGGFEHVSGYGINQLATEQGYYALVSYYRMLDGKTALYDMTDIKDEPIFSQDASDTEQNGQEDNANTEGAAEGSETVKTGDQNDLAMLWVICGLGAAGTVFAAYSRKKEN